MTDLNIIVGVQSGNAIRQLSNVQKGVDNVGVATRRTTQRLREHATQYNKTAVAANKFGKGLAQQAGYQVADFAVQLQNGTSFLQAFGQQGSQMLAVFGPLGSVLGAVVAVGAALGTVFQKSTISTKGFKEEIANLNKELEILRSGAGSEEEFAQKKKIAAIDAQIFKIEQQITGLTENKKVNAESILENYNKTLTSLKEERRIEQESLDFYLKSLQTQGKRLSNFELEKLVLSELAAINKEEHEKAIARMNKEHNLLAKVYQDQKNEQQRINDLRQKQFDTAQLSLQQQIQIVQTEIALRKELGKKIKDEAELQILLEQQKISIMNSGKLLTTSQIIQLQDMTREFLEQKGALQEILDLEARRAKALSGAADVTKEIMMFGDGLEDAFVEPEKKAKSAARSIAKSFRQEITPEMQRIIDLSNSIGSSFENAMMSAVRGTMSVKDAFRAMASDIISELYRVFVVKQITGFITQSLQSAFGVSQLDQGISLRPRARPRAAGGPVSAGSPYLVGERGPELIVPNRSGTVIPNNKLGGGGVVVNQVINISTGVQQTVRAEIRQLMPQIADSAKAAVSDAKRRGGSYGRAFA
jgi:hypothetical protein